MCNCDLRPLEQTSFKKQDGNQGRMNKQGVGVRFTKFFYTRPLKKDIYLYVAESSRYEQDLSVPISALHF